MKKLFRTVFVLPTLLIFFGLSACIETGDEERPGIAISSDLLLTKVWEVDMFKDDGMNKTGLFDNIYLEFRPNFVFRITQDCNIIDGEWVISNDSSFLVIRLPDTIEPLDQLEDEWVITWLSETEMHLLEQDNRGDEEFHLKVAPLQSLSCDSCSQLTDKLTTNYWSITGFSTLSKQYTDESRGGYLDFKQSGSVVFFIDGEEIAGSWALTDQCQTLVIKWTENDSYSDLQLQMEDHWVISEDEQDSFVLEADNANRLELSQGRFQDCTELHDSVINTSWTIEYVSINGDDVSESFTGNGLTFLENNQLATEVFIGPAVLGEWMLLGGCDQLSIQVGAGQLKELSKDWTITEILNNQITLAFEEGALTMQMRMVKGKPQPTQKCLELLDQLKDKKWAIGKFTENGSVVYSKLQDYQFQFAEDGELLVYDDQQEIIGSWYPAMNCKRLMIQIDSEGVITRINGNWKIEMINNEKIILVYEKPATSKIIELITT